MLNNISNKCPVCEHEGISIRSLEKKTIMNELEHYFAEKPPEEIEVIDYEIQQCKNCSLEYAFPLEPGSQSFYQWVTTRANYYPESRWEWLTVIEQIKNRKGQNLVSILDVGCGGGNFLEIAQKIPNIHLVGLDTTPESVSQCKERGFEVYCETIESFHQNYPDEKFDYIVSFHCLEHIDKPKAFVESMLCLLKTEGSLFISTPYSPMSFEQEWFDIMNHPPHHMTRWNKKAYDELAWQLKCNVQYMMPPPSSILQRTVNTLKLVNFGRNQLTISKLKLLQSLCLNFTQFLGVLVRQSAREKINGMTIADVVLVELTQSKS